MSLLDPQLDWKTSKARTSARQAYVEKVKAAWDRYSADKEKARAEYLKYRRGYLSGTILRPTLKQLIYVWPTDAQLAEFDERDAGQLAEFEKMIFIAAHRCGLAECAARLAYWNAVETSEGPVE